MIQHESMAHGKEPSPQTAKCGAAGLFGWDRNLNASLGSFILIKPSTDRRPFWFRGLNAYAMCLYFESLGARISFVTLTSPLPAHLTNQLVNPCLQKLCRLHHGSLARNIGVPLYQGGTGTNLRCFISVKCTYPIIKISGPLISN